MMYLSKGIICKGKSKYGIYIRHFGQPMEIFKEQAVMWQRAQYGFADIITPAELATAEILVKKGIAVIEKGNGDLEKYHALCRCAICAYPKKKLSLIPLKKEEKTLLVWLRKAGTNLTLPELVSLQDKNVKPCRELLYQENAVKLLKIIHPWCVSMAGELESRMKHSVARKRTVDSILELLRKKLIVIM